jgi:hypothetical protein
MRLKPDGTLNHRPAPPTQPWDQMTVEEQRQQLIDELLHYHPTMTPETAAELIDAAFWASGLSTPACHRRCPAAAPPDLLLRPRCQPVEQFGVPVHPPCAGGGPAAPLCG